MLKRLNKEAENQLLAVVTELICMGAEDKINLWVLGQSHLVKQLELDTSIQANMGVYAKSRNGYYQSVKAAIADQYLVRNPVVRKRLQEQLDAYQRNPNYDKILPIAFSTLGGNALYTLPDLRAIKMVQINQNVLPAQPQSVLPENDCNPVEEAIKINSKQDAIAHLKGAMDFEAAA